MPVIATADFPSISPELYTQIHPQVMATGRPEGMIAHGCYPKGTGITVVDLWDSQAMFEAFISNRVAPTLEKLGIEGGPENLVVTDLLNADAFDFTGRVLSQ